VLPDWLSAIAVAGDRGLVLVESSVVEQRHQAVMEVLAGLVLVTEIADRFSADKAGAISTVILGRLRRRWGYLGGSMSPTITQRQIDGLLAVVRLGDADRLGWWRSHSLDETGEYVLAHAFPNTWMATGVELAMESARVRHNMALDRRTAVHLFSDYLPFHREVRSWLIQRKLEKNFEPLVWLRAAPVEALMARLGAPAIGESRGDGMYLGDLPRECLDDDVVIVEEYFARLVSAYAGLGNRFAAPYLDLV
jgi:hypothetical protein